jgi:hypothetical protein
LLLCAKHLSFSANEAFRSARLARPDAGRWEIFWELEIDQFPIRVAGGKKARILASKSYF